MNFEFGLEGIETYDTQNKIITSPTIENILSKIKSGVGLDIAKNHTGITIWENGELKTLGFKLKTEYNVLDQMCEAKMRLEFKEKLTEVLGGKHFEVCALEDVFLGSNFDTVRKLLSLNTVTDELLLTGAFSAERFYRRLPSEWLSDFRRIIKIGKGLKTKYETQEILRYINFKFLIENDDLCDSDKEDIFFEDICDSAGILCSTCVLDEEKELNKRKDNSLDKIKMYYLEDYEDIESIRDRRIKNSDIKMPAFTNEGGLEVTVINLLEQYEDEVVAICVDNSSLGRLGLKRGFRFYEQGYGYLIFYKKGKVANDSSK